MNLDKPWAMDIGPGNLDLPWLSVTDGLLLVAPFQTSGDFYSIANGRMESLITETVDGDRTKRSWGGQLVSATASEARWQPGRGVLIEGTDINLCLQSNDFDTTWTTGASPVAIAQNEIGPDGVADSAWTLTDDSAAVGEVLRQYFTVADDANDHTAVAFLKKTTGALSTYPGIQLNYSGGNALAASVIVDTTNGTIADVSAPDDSGIEDYNATYWRVYITMTNNASGNTQLALFLRPAFSSDGTTEDLAATGSAVFYGAQLEKASTPSSYIPTTTTSVTGTADVAAVTVANHFAAAAGSVILAIRPSAATQTGFILDLSADADNEFWLKLAAGKPQFKVERATVEQANLTATSAIAADTRAILGSAWDANDVRLYVDGADEKSDSAATMPAAINANAFIGCDIASANQLGGEIEMGLAYNRALPAGEIASVTRNILEVLA